MMQLTTTINVVEVGWVAVAVIGLLYGLVVRADAVADVRARHASSVNSGREELAHLLVMTASLMTFAFVCFLASGLLAMTIPSARSAPPRTYLVQSGLTAAEIALAFCLYYKQKIRRRVLKRDMQNEEVRAAAALLLAAQQRQDNTAALVELTHAIQHTATAAQEDNTRATEENSEAIAIHTEIAIKKRDEDAHG